MQNGAVKKTLKTEWYRILLIILGLAVIGTTIFLGIEKSKDISYCYGSGETSNYTQTTTGSYAAKFYKGDWTWTVITNHASPSTTQDAIAVGTIYNESVGWVSTHSAITFDVSDYQDKDVTRVVLGLYCTDIDEQYEFFETFAFYCGDPSDPEDWVASDGRRWDYEYTKERYSELLDVDDLTDDSYVYWEIYDIEHGDWDYIMNDDDGLVPFYFMTNYHYLEYAPEAPPSGIYNNSYDFDNPTGSHPPRLYFDYVADTAERVVNLAGNAATDNTTDGTEVADNITWASPRCAYADDVNGIALWVNGDSGAAIDLDLLDVNNDIVDSDQDSIRTDGKYEYSIDLPNNYYGWVRLVENNFNLVSDWGYVMPAPDEDQLTNTVYAVNTEYPQYDFAFRRYLTYENDLFVLHYKTNMADGEQTDHDLEIWGNSENATPLTGIDFDWLVDNYFMPCNPDNEYLYHWRYIIMTPNIEGSGFDDRDNLVYNMDQNYGVNTQGFLQAVIIDTTDNSTLADSHSCYWYIPTEPDGLMFRLDKSAYKPTDDITVSLNVGNACQAPDHLPSLRMQIINEAGTSEYTEYQSYSYGSNIYTFEAPVDTGNYEIRFTFSGDGSWDYIHDEPFIVAVTAGLMHGEGLQDMIEGWFSDWGLDNDLGYWLALLIGMVVLFLLAYKSPVMRVALPLIYCAIFIVMGWVDRWIIILLAIGAGVFLFSMLRKRVAGGGGSESE